MSVTAPASLNLSRIRIAMLVSSSARLPPVSRWISTAMTK
jgi:hypothetical protein